MCSNFKEAKAKTYKKKKTDLKTQDPVSFFYNNNNRNKNNMG